MSNYPNGLPTDSELHLVDCRIEKAFPVVYRFPEVAPWRAEPHESQPGRHIGDFYNGLPSR